MGSSDSGGTPVVTSSPAHGGNELRAIDTVDSSTGAASVTGACSAANPGMWTVGSEIVGSEIVDSEMVDSLSGTTPGSAAGSTTTDSTTGTSTGSATGSMTASPRRARPRRRTSGATSGRIGGGSTGTAAAGTASGVPHRRPAAADSCRLLTAPSKGSGANHSTPAGGNCSTADAGRPCHTDCSASTAPRLPTPDPP